MELAIFQSATEAERTPDARLDQLQMAIAAEPPDLVLCPELFLSGYNTGDQISRWAEPATGPFSEKIAAIAADTGTAIAYGYPERADGAFYNSVQVIAPNGERVANHRKRVAAPYSFEEQLFTNANSPTCFDHLGIRIGVIICYEVEMPEYVRQAARAGVQLLLVPTALSREWAVVAEKMVPTRALENGIWLAYANHAGHENGLDYLGGSRIVAPDGQEAAIAGEGAELIRAAIDPEKVTAMQKRLPYLRDAPDLSGYK